MKLETKSNNDNNTKLHIHVQERKTAPMHTFCDHNGQ